MTKSTNRSELHEVLERLEAALERPVVPGELASWVRSASDVCSRVGVVLRREVDEAHQQCYAEISDRDDGLLHRVERMREEDRILLDVVAELETEASRLVEEASRVGPREGELETTRSEFAKRGLDFVIRVRTQESALRTWYGEAFYRDRGTVD